MSNWFDDLKKQLDRKPMWYGRKGEPLELEEYARRFEDMDYRRVGYDEIPATRLCPATYLSTVWLGIDHSFGLSGPPIIFETMRFSLERTEESPMMPGRKYHQTFEFPYPEDPTERTEQVRYCTEEQASLGHKLILRLIQEHEMT